MSERNEYVAPVLDNPTFFTSEPEIALAGLRRDKPVWYDEALDVWVLSRYEDVSVALRSPEIFASRFGVAPDEHGRPELLRDRTVEGSEFLLIADPPLHGRLRAIVQPGFRQRMIDSWEARVRDYIKVTLDPIEDAEAIDVFAQVAKPIALTSICAFIGIPASDVTWIGAEIVRPWIPAHVRAAQGGAPLSGGKTLEEYFASALAERAQSPADDLLTLIATATDPAADAATKLMFCIDMLIAGDEPAAAAISGGVRALVEHPEQLAALVSDPALASGAADEILRWVSPVPVMCRTAVQDIAVQGTVIPAGSYVYLLLTSANRDESAWDRADRFDVSRPDAAKHVAFGRGPHTCIGAGVVRRLLRIFLEELLAQFDGIEAAGDVEYHPSTHMPTISRLPARLRRRSGT